jgi:hypothetical protein
MAGQLTIDTLRASSGVLASQNGMTGICKAWVMFTGSTAVVNSSFNVSSVTRNSAGNYTVNFTTAMANANYAGTIAVAYYTSGSAPSNVGEFWAGTRTTSAYQIAMQNSAASGYQDSPFVSVCIFGA